MNAKRIFAAAAFAIVTAACGGGSSPPLADTGNDADTFKLPKAPPTDTTGFVPEG